MDKRIRYKKMGYSFNYGQRLIHFCQKVAPFLIDKQNKALKILKTQEG